MNVSAGCQIPRDRIVTKHSKPKTLNEYTKWKWLSNECKKQYFYRHHQTVLLTLRSIKGLRRGFATLCYLPFSSDHHLCWPVHYFAVSTWLLVMDGLHGVISYVLFLRNRARATSRIHVAQAQMSTQFDVTRATSHYHTHKKLTVRVAVEEKSRSDLYYLETLCIKRHRSWRQVALHM